ncbi:MAG: ZPR1 zinc finger domain-containing protein [Candidatus Diapherotrites archaeon]|nr:ZPR1 zinc finger domain-containing protein [Candidatus Diapherotrites archaeon]
MEQVIDNAICPACGKKTLRTVIVEKELPRFGRAVLVTSKCSACGYTHTDVMELEDRGHKKLRILVDDPKKLNALVVRSAGATVRIPEFDLEMLPGPFSNGFITTVEGVLDRFESAAEKIVPESEEEKDAKETALREIREAKDGKRQFTLEIDDPRGVSGIILSDDASSEQEQ